MLVRMMIVCMYILQKFVEFLNTEKKLRLLSPSLSLSFFHAPARPRQAGTLSSHMQDQRIGCSNIRFNSASHARCAWSLSDSSESDGIEEGGETGSVADGVNGIFSIARAI